MELKTGRDGYPVIDQLSEEGFVDLTFAIIELVEDDEYLRFLLAASFAGEVVGMGAVLRKEIGAGWDSGMNLIQAHVYRRGLRIFRAGEQSDRLVGAIRNLYGMDGGSIGMVDEEDFTVIALHQGKVDLNSEPVKLKIFGRDEEPFDEEAYNESYFNVDLPNRLVFWNEKDPDYRGPLLRGLTSPKKSPIEGRPQPGIP